MDDDNKSLTVGLVVAAIGAITTGLAWCFGKNKGHAEGKKEGYVKASDEYRWKMLEQEEKFASREKRMEKNAEEKDRIVQELIARQEQKDVTKQDQNVATTQDDQSLREAVKKFCQQVAVPEVEPSACESDNLDVHRWDDLQITKLCWFK